MSQYQAGALYLWPLSELEEYGEVDCDDDGEGEQELRQAGDHGVGHLPLALPRVLPQQSEQGCHGIVKVCQCEKVTRPHGNPTWHKRMSDRLTMSERFPNSENSMNGFTCKFGYTVTK